MSAENFKSWAKTGPISLAPITGFFGTNSSGKTSLLQLLLLMKQTTASADRRQVMNFGDDRSPVSLGLIRDVLHLHDLDRSLRLSYSWKTKSPFSYSDPAHPDRKLFETDRIAFATEVAVREEQLFVESLSYSGTDVSIRMSASKAPRYRREPEYRLDATVNGDDSYLKRVPGRAWPLPAPTKSYGFPDEVQAYFQNAEFVAAFELELERQFGDRTFYLGPLRSYPERQYTWQGSRPADVGVSGDRAVDALLASRRRGPVNARELNRIGHAKKRMTVEENVAEWLVYLDLISSFDVERISKDADIYRVLVKRSADSAPVLLTDVGFGVSQILPVLVLLAYVDEGSTVLLEQPEIHLHPAVQAGLADVVMETALARNVQVIVESHSEHFLRRLQRRVAEQKLRPEHVALYFSDQEHGESTLRELSLNLFGEIDNWPDNFFGDPLGETAAIVRAGIKHRGTAASR